MNARHLRRHRPKVAALALTYRADARPAWAFALALAGALVLRLLVA
jgi:hypothetical protein